MKLSSASFFTSFIVVFGRTSAVADPGDSNTFNDLLPNANGGGDPHFKTWGGEKFDFHGECELVLVRNPTFLHGLGMHIHGRTKSHADARWSSFESIAVQILEVKGNHQYWFNGVENAMLPAHINGYEVKMRKQPADNKQQPATDESFPTYKFDIELGHGEKIYIIIYNELAWVGFVKPLPEDFYDADGLLGNYKTGQKLARDGEAIIHDANMFGQEWQVRDTDPKLFSSINTGPMRPQQCKMPDLPTVAQRRRRRRLGQYEDDNKNHGIIISREDAKKACASVAHSAQQQDCILDVQATNNVAVAAAAAYEYDWSASETTMQV